MNASVQWLFDLNATSGVRAVDGLVLVSNHKDVELTPEERTVLEKAESYGAHSVFFEGSRNGRPPVAQAFIFVSSSATSDEEFADLHKRLWSWGGVPLVYRKTSALVQMFRCAHKPDFEQNGKIVLRPFKILNLAAQITGQLENQPWWDAERLRNGTLWDDRRSASSFSRTSKRRKRRSSTPSVNSMRIWGIEEFSRSPFGDAC